MSTTHVDAENWLLRDIDERRSSWLVSIPLMRDAAGADASSALPMSDAVSERAMSARYGIR